MRKSYFGMPLSLIAHIITINLILYLCTSETYRHGFSILYYNLSWLLVTYSIDFYPKSRRKGSALTLLNFLRLFLIYSFVYFASFSFWKNHNYSLEYITLVYALICMLLMGLRFLFSWLFILYYKSKVIKVAVIGWDSNLKKIRKMFDDPSLNYEYIGFFDNKKSQSPTYLGDISTSFAYIFENDIDEVYCTASKLSKEELKELINIADNSLKRINIIPDNKELFSRSMSIELYGPVPVLHLRSSPLQMEYANIVKRSFDILFASLVILLILSWLTPLVYLLMKFDSKGPLFFKQKRHGVNLNSFWCYKFRSMAPSRECHTKMASKNDLRITRLGRILRKTSIDELPQFYNVLKGDMSVVGPRPHMELHTQEFETSVDKYLVRHFVKPGVTGLAQIRGYRGEIVRKSDIVNRVRYDIFYLEKWSIRLDARIIYLTVFNAIKGDKKAY